MTHSTSKTHYYLIIILLCLTSYAFSQQSSAELNDLVDEEITKAEVALGASADSALIITDSLIAKYKRNKNLYGAGRAQSFKAWILTFNAQYEDALKLAHETLKLQRKLNHDSIGIALTLNRIGVANMQFERYDDAQKYISEALSYFIELEDSTRAEAGLTNLGSIAYYRGEHRDAINYYKQSYRILKNQNEFQWMGYSLSNIAELYLTEGNMDSAENYYNQSLAIFEDTLKANVPAMILLGIADLQRRKGFPIRAITYTIQALDRAYDKQHTELVLSGKKLLSTLYYETKSFQKAYETRLEYDALQAETDSINSAEGVAEIEERYKNAEKQAQILTLQTENLEAQNKAQRSGLLAVIAICTTVIAISILLVLFWLRQQKHKIHASQLETRVVESKLIALRAQMNPHFIFNCINTAQNFVLDSAKRDAYDYLAKFARLLRMILHNSSKTFVSLQEEIEQLELYIQLEKIRFSSKFDYQIEIHPPLKEGLFEIPGMMLQPLVENAILHGLINKEDQLGLLKLSFCLNKNTIKCSITDNGVGRIKAAAIKGQKPVHYQSSALPNIQARLQSLTGNNQDIQLKITDLHKDGQAIGTRVEIELPWQ